MGIWSNALYITMLIILQCYSFSKTVQMEFEWRQTKGRLLGSNRLEDRLVSDATHVYSLRAERVYSSSSEKCLLLVKHDQIVMQINHRRTHKEQDRFAEGA